MSKEGPAFLEGTLEPLERQIGISRLSVELRDRDWFLITQTAAGRQGFRGCSTRNSATDTGVSFRIEDISSGEYPPWKGRTRYRKYQSCASLRTFMRLRASDR
jgi:hypothetical protein